MTSQVAEIEEAEKDKMRSKCKKIIDHGVNVFINRQLIYNFPEQVRDDEQIQSSSCDICGRGTRSAPWGGCAILRWVGSKRCLLHASYACKGSLY